MAIQVKGEVPVQQAEVWHYWVVHENWANNIPLCAEAEGEDTWRVTWSHARFPIGITIIKAEVTCSECLEWLHA